jgi:hypothetical protein
VWHMPCHIDGMRTSCAYHMVFNPQCGPGESCASTFSPRFVTRVRTMATCFQCARRDRRSTPDVTRTGDETEPPQTKEIACGLLVRRVCSGEVKLQQEQQCHIEGLRALTQQCHNIRRWRKHLRTLSVRPSGKSRVFVARSTHLYRPGAPATLGRYKRCS